MEKASKIDINEEYEKLVPPTKRESIFEDSEDYDSLRQFIIDQPRVVYPKKTLPFSGIMITSYVEYKKQDVIEKKKEKGKHIFYLKQSCKGKSDFCDAAGYYIKLTKEFVVLPYSHIINVPIGTVPEGYSRNGKLDGINQYTISPIIFESPEEASSYVLGQKAGLDEWVDEHGKGLLNYYKELAEPLPQSIDNTINERENPPSNHLFHIKKNTELNRICDAKGYYDVTTKNFILLSGSIWSLEVSKSYFCSASEILRRNIIKRNCRPFVGAYEQYKDVLCASPSQAATYVIGQNANGLEEWVDEDGKRLIDIYKDIIE